MGKIYYSEFYRIFILCIMLMNSSLNFKMINNFVYSCFYYIVNSKEKVRFKRFTTMNFTIFLQLAYIV